MKFDVYLGPPGQAERFMADDMKQYQSLRNDTKWPPEECRNQGIRGVLSLGLCKDIWGRDIENFGKKLMHRVRATVDFQKPTSTIIFPCLLLVLFIFPSPILLSYL